MNNGALLSKRLGSAPEHTDYCYTLLGYGGEESYQLYFSEYPASVSQGKPVSDRYFINDTEVTKSVYDSMTAQLLSIGDNAIVWQTLS